jgi:hypothetical protein
MQLDMPVCPTESCKQLKITGIKYNFAGAGKEMTHKDVSKKVIVYYVIRLHDSRMASEESPDYRFVSLLHIFPRWHCNAINILSSALKLTQ